MRTVNIVHCLVAATAASAHFALEIPTSIGFNDEKLNESPCGSFDPTDRSKGVTKWSVEGGNIGVISTHGKVTWEINAALVSEPTKWLPLVREFAQSGVGSVCIQRVPGFSAWIGKPVVLQIVQHGHDGDLYQCAAIEFTAGGPDSVPSGCTNSNGVTMDPLVPGPGPAPAPSASSPSSVSAGASSTATAPHAAPPASSASVGHGVSSGVSTASASTRPSSHGGAGHEGQAASSSAITAGPTKGTSPPAITAAAAASAIVGIQVVMGAVAAFAAILMLVIV